MGDNLPDGVTASDIDDHYGHPETNTLVGEVAVGVEIEAPEWMSEREIKEELREQVTVGQGQVLHAEIIEQR